MGNREMGKPSAKELMKGKFFAFLKATSLGPDLDRDHIHIGHSYGRNCLLLGWSHQPFKEAIDAVREICPEVSEKTAGEALGRSMRKLFHQYNVGEDADPEADAPLLESIIPTLDSAVVNEEATNLLDRLKSEVKTWSVFLFVEGVQLKNLSELPLGMATLYPRTRGPLLRVLQDVKDTKGLRRIPQDIEDNAKKCECYLTIDIEGEDRYVNQQALLQAQDVVNVLNLYMAYSHHRTSHQRINIVGQPTIADCLPILKRTPPMGVNSDSPGYSYFEQFPPGRHYEIDSIQIQQWKKHGLEKVLESIKPLSTKPGSAASRIRNAITWYGRAMNANTSDEQFVSLTTALESLLVADEEVSITQRLADEVSALLGGNFESREDIKKRTRELYNQRGRIVHAGMPISQENLHTLNTIVAETILAFVRREETSS